MSPSPLYLIASAVLFGLHYHVRLSPLDDCHGWTDLIDRYSPMRPPWKNANQVFLQDGCPSDASGVHRFVFQLTFFSGLSCEILFSDNTAARTLKIASFDDVTNMTIEECINFCAPSGFKFAGLEFSRV